jgi:hypothetical protein
MHGKDGEKEKCVLIFDRETLTSTTWKIRRDP